MKRSFLRPMFALGLVAGGLTACDDVMSAINIFMVKFFDGGGSTKLIAPAGVSEVISWFGARQVAARSANTAEIARIDGIIDNLVDKYTNKSSWGINLAYGLGADNSGNSDRAAFPGRAALDLFVQSKGNSPMTATLDTFSVAGQSKDTINCNFPLTLDKLPDESFNSMLKGDSIPYFMKGRVGFDLKAPSGEVLSSHNTEMDLATSKMPTRPNDEQTRQFLDIAKGYL
jgi:hypothetical protein